MRLAAGAGRSSSAATGSPGSTRELAAAFRPGDRLVVVQETGDLLHVPACRARRGRRRRRRGERRRSPRSVDVTDEQITDVLRRASPRASPTTTTFAGDRRGQRRRRRPAPRRGRSTTVGSSCTPTDARRHGRRPAQLARQPDPPRATAGRRVEHDGWSVESSARPARRRRLRLRGPARTCSPTPPACCAPATPSCSASAATRWARRGRSSRTRSARRSPTAGLPAGAVQLVDSPARAAGWALFADAPAGARRRPRLGRRRRPARRRRPPARRAGQPARHRRRMARRRRRRRRRRASPPPSSTRSTARCATRSTSAASSATRPDLVEVFDVAAARGPRRARGVDTGRAPSWPSTTTRLATEWEWEDAPEVALVVVDDVDQAVAACNRYSPHFVASLISDDAGRARRVLRRRRRAVRRRRLHPLGRRPVRPRPARARPVELAGRPAVRPRRRAVRRLGAHRAPARHGSPTPTCTADPSPAVRGDAAVSPRSIRLSRPCRGRARRVACVALRSPALVGRCARRAAEHGGRPVAGAPAAVATGAGSAATPHRRRRATPGAHRPADAVTDRRTPVRRAPHRRRRATGAGRTRSRRDRRRAVPRARQPRARRAALRRRPDLRPRGHDVLSGTVGLDVRLTEDRDEITLDAAARSSTRCAVDGVDGAFAPGRRRAADHRRRRRCTPATPVASTSTYHAAGDRRAQRDGHPGRLVRHRRRLVRAQRARRGAHLAAEQRPPERQGDVRLHDPRRPGRHRRGQRRSCVEHDHDRRRRDVAVARGRADGDVPRPAADRRLRAGRRHRPGRPAADQRGPAQRAAAGAAAARRDRPSRSTTSRRYFGPYPLDRYGIAVTDSFSGLAMETQGRSMFSRDDLGGGADRYDRRVAVARAGPPVVRRRGHAGAVAGHLAERGRSPRTASGCGCEHVGVGDDRRRRPTPRWPIRPPGVDRPTRRSATCSASTRTRAAPWCCTPCALTIGDDAFFDAAAPWVADNDGTSRTTEDFIALAEEVAGRTSTEFFDDWLFGGGSGVVPDAAPTPARHQRRLRRW